MELTISMLFIGFVILATVNRYPLDHQTVFVTSEILKVSVGTDHKWGEDRIYNSYKSHYISQ